MIDILYMDSQEPMALQIKDSLEKSGKYHARLVPYQKETFPRYVRNTSAKDCQLIISLEMIGFSSIDSDASPFLNHLPMNILVIMDGWPTLYDKVLKTRLNFTIYFLHSDPAAVDYIKHVYPHIHTVDLLSDLDMVPEYLDSMDWRYPYSD